MATSPTPPPLPLDLGQREHPNPSGECVQDRLIPWGELDGAVCVHAVRVWGCSPASWKPAGPHPAAKGIQQQKQASTNNQRHLEGHLANGGDPDRRATIQRHHGTNAGGWRYPG